MLIARIAHRAGGHGAHADYIQLAVDLRHARQIFAHELDGLGGNAAVLENAGAQPRDLAFRGQKILVGMPAPVSAANIRTELLPMSTAA